MSTQRERGEANAPDYHEENRYFQQEKQAARKRKRKEMAVDMSGGMIMPAQAEPAQVGIMERIETHPLIALFFALVIAVAIGFLISKIRGGSSTQGASTSTTNAPGTSEGLPTTDAQGNKVYYVPTSNTFLDYNNIQSSYNPNNSVATTTTSTVNTTNNSDVDAGQSENPPSTSGHYIGAKPLIPYGQYKGPSYSHLAPNTHYTYNGVNYRLSAGAGGRLWGTTPWGATYLLYGPSGYYGPQFETQTVNIPAGYPGAFNAAP